jgi:antitoxin MazE
MVVAAVHVRHLVTGVRVGRRSVITVAHVVHCEAQSPPAVVRETDPDMSKLTLSVDGRVVPGEPSAWAPNDRTSQLPGSVLQRDVPPSPASPRHLVIHWKHGAPHMVKRLTKHGNSLALVIDRSILDLLKIDPETLLEVSTDGKQLIVAPAKPSAQRKKFEAAQEWAHKRYGKAFQKLAQ